MLNLSGFFSVLAGLLLLASSTIGLVARGRLNGIVSNVLALAVVAYATIVLLAQILSELGAVHRSGFLIGHLVIALLALPWNLKLYRPAISAALAAWTGRTERFKQVARANPALSGLGLLVLASMVLGAYLIIVVPPNIYDSLSYHLTRVAYWLQNGTLRHFQTPDPIKIAHQGYNAEMGLLWLTALWGVDRLTGFMQWSATGLAGLAVYGVARQLKFSLPAALFAALIWNSLTVVVLQATSTKSDMLVAFFVIAAFYFLLAGLRDAERKYSPHLILFGLSLGLALGTKSMAALVLPGLVLGCGGLLLFNPARFWPKLAYGAVWSLLGLVLVGSYNYALNWLEYGAVFGPVDLTLKHTVQSPSLKTFQTNMGRIIYHFFDPGGLPDPVVDYVQRWRPQLGQKLFAALDIAPNLAAANLNTFSFDGVRQVTPREDAAWYGPLGFFLFLPAVLYYLVIPPLSLLLKQLSGPARFKRAKTSKLFPAKAFAEENLWRWFIALASFLFIVAFALLVRWQTHMGRLLLIAVVLGAPLMAGFYDRSGWRKAARWLVMSLAAVVLVWSATHNFHKSVFGPNSFWALDYYQRRALQNPRLARAHRYLDGQIPPNSRIGLAGDEAFMRWDYLFFGPDLSRRVTYLGPKLDRIDEATFARPNVEYLVLGSYPPHDIDSEAPLWPVIEESGQQWFLIKRSELELFAPQPAPTEIYHQTFGDDYLAFLDIAAHLEREAQPVRVLTTDPRMPYYNSDQRFTFGLPEDIGDLTGYTHLVVAPWWSPQDYERLDISFEEVQSFLAEEKFVEKVTEINGYALYRLLF